MDRKGQAMDLTEEGACSMNWSIHRVSLPTHLLLYVVTMTATFDALTMVGMAEIPNEAAPYVLNNRTVRDFATMHYFPEAIRPRTFASGANIGTFTKCINLAIDQCERLGAPI
jgi:NAD-binding of NADP-dependent 3-hydroxyisobutyrate dehydrogenase